MRGRHTPPCGENDMAGQDELLAAGDRVGRLIMDLREEGVSDLAIAIALVGYGAEFCRLALSREERERVLQRLREDLT